MAQTTVIVGAGIVGSYCALQLSTVRDPRSITIVDSAPFAYDNTSCVNMGGFATSEVYPLARLQNIWRAIRWLPNPQAPLALRLRYVPELMPWLRVFLRSAVSKKHFDHVVSSQQALMKRASQAHAECLGSTGLEKLISGDGAICVYKTRKRFQSDWNGRWRLFREQGFVCHSLAKDELHNYLPELAANIQYGIYVPDIRFWVEPKDLLRGLHDVLKNRGVGIEVASVDRITAKDRGSFELELSTGTELACTDLVIAAGAFSKKLCKDLDDDVPLDTERGYSTTLPESGIGIDHLLLLVEDDFVATPMRSGLRLGGTVELAGLTAAPNFARTELLANQIRTYFPTVNTDGRIDMIGYRPSMPDGLPVISQSSVFDNAYYAFGHGHVGMTQSAITGRLIAQLVGGAEPEMNVQPYSVGRFRK
ncbi:MAG: NAD(P)/FAD-dependent oxidoreductase [Woeseiaceae bacterium]